MTYEKDPFEFEGIPDFALQPAKGEDEYNFHYIPRGATSRFDPAAYERVLHESVKQAAEVEEPEMLDVHENRSPDANLETAAEKYPESFEELIPVAFEDTQAAAPGYVEAGFGSSIVYPETEVLEAGNADSAVGCGETLDAAAGQMEAVLEPEPVFAPDGEVSEPVFAPDGELSEPVFAPEEEEEAIAVFIPQAPERDQLVSVNAPEDETEEATVEPLFEKNTIPLFSAASASHPVFQATIAPKTPPQKAVPVVGSLISSKLKLVDMKQKAPLRIFVEEDILVPDVKPDLERILSMDGKVRLADREVPTGQSEINSLKLLGDVTLQTLYVPEHKADGEPIVSIESKIPFKSEAEIKAGPNSELTITPYIESIDYTVVNERKFRAKAAVVFGVKEYSNVDVEVFEGVRNEEVQMLKEKINLTDVATRKTESIEIKDDLMLKENSPEILKVLKYDVNVVENHKQVTKEKAVINASVYCNVLYLGTEGNSDISKAEDSEEASEAAVIPVLYQGKTEFTQFIRLDDASNEQNPAGSKVSFNVTSLNLNTKEDGSGKKNLFELDMNVDTGLELYRNIEKDVVTDVYHHKKDVQYETNEIGISSLGGSGAAEISAREIVNIPEKYGNVDKVVFLSGNIGEKRSFIDQSKSVIEGTVNVNMICTSADADKTVFSVAQEIPFRSAMEIPGINQDMTPMNDVALKELWFDKINNKQVEVNAGILVNTAVASQKNHQLIKDISFLESQQDNTPAPGLVLYVARPGDTIWKIAKKYRTTVDELSKMNELEGGKEIKPVTKLLIVAKKY